MTPNLERILTYKSIWAACVLGKDGKLHASHYAACLVSGRNPLWGVWNLNGKFQQFFGGREEMHRAYPEHIWRRVMARWKLNDDTDVAVKQRRALLAKELNAPLPVEEENDHGHNVIPIRKRK